MHPARLLRPAGMQEKLLISLGAGQVAGFDAKNLEGKRCGGGLNRGDGALMKVRIRDDAAGADVFAAEFKLGFDEDEKIGAGGGAGNGGGKNFGDGDEGDVGHDERCGFGEVGELQFAGIALDAEDTRVLLEFPVQLIGVDVNGEDFGGAVLQKAVGEATIGGAEVEANRFCWVH
jgi:hypothetical protein